MLKNINAILERVNWWMVRVNLAVGSVVVAFFIVLSILFIIIGQPRSGFTLLGLVLMMVLAPAAVCGLALVILRIGCWIFRIPLPRSEKPSRTSSPSTDGNPVVSP